MKNEYIEGFKEFLEGGISEESFERYRSAVSSYFKALAQLCDCILFVKQNKRVKNHQERFLFLQVNYPEIYALVADLFKEYTDTYVAPKKKEDCNKVKDGIKKIIKLGNVEKEFEKLAEKI